MTNPRDDLMALADQFPEVREIGGGAWCVDYGLHWFRVRPDGSILVREVYKNKGEEFASVRTRSPTSDEEDNVRWLINASNNGVAP